VVLPELNFTVAQPLAARLLNGSPDIVTFGPCSKPEEAELASSPTASVCSVVPLALESDGFGTVKTMSGPRFTANTSEDGFM